MAGVSVLIVAAVVVAVLLSKGEASSGSDSDAQFSDFVVVGAGTAGCALAAKLCSALPNHHITLLERGAPRSDESEFLVEAPRNLFPLWSDRNVTQAYPSEPDEGIQNRSTTVLAGTTAGGSSAINGMQWTVPLPGSVEQWRINGLTTRSASSFYQRAYQTVEFDEPKFPLQYADDYIRAAVRAGFPQSTNPFVQPDRAVWQNRLAIDGTFRRSDSCSAYLKPVMNSVCARNLQLVLSQTASRILFERSEEDGGRLKAVGVQTLDTFSPNITRSFYARRNVVLSAGPYESAHLLQLSGVGPKSVLDAANISQILELPVGQTCVSRASASVASRYTGVRDEPANNMTLVNSQAERDRFETGRGGILATPVSAANGRVGGDGYFGAGFVPFFPGPREFRTQCFHNGRTLASVTTVSDDPFDTPKVKLNLLANDNEVGQLVSCLQQVLDIHRALPPEFNATVTEPVGGVVTEAYVRETANTGAHFVGCCAVDDVVDGDLNVLRVDGLKVVDASVIREMPKSAGPAASVYMIAEFMAERMSSEVLAEERTMRW